MIVREAAAVTPTRDGRKRRSMYYYAHLNADGICDAVYTFPSIIHDPDYIRVTSASTHIVGQYWNAALSEFQTVYYYACLNEKGLVEETVFFIAAKQETTDRFREITFEQYNTVKGLWWNGTDYVEPPIHIKAVASTDEINYDGQDVWLTTVLDEMQEHTAENRARIGALENATGNNTAEIASARVQIQLANDRMDGIASVVEGHTSDIAEMEQTISDMDSGIKTQFNTVDNSFQAIGKELTEFEADINKLASNVGSIESAQSAQANKIVTLEVKASAAENDIIGLKNAVEVVREEVADNADEIAALQTDLDAASTNITSVASRATKLENRATALENRASAIEKNVTANKNGISSLNSSVTEIDADIANLQSEIDGAEAEIASVLAKANTNAKSISSLTTRTTNVENRATAVEKRANTNASNISAATSRMTAAEKAIDAVEADVATVKSDMENYFPTSGGTISGDVNVDGVLRMNGSQAFYYNVDAKTMNIGTNNATTVNLAGVHSGGTMNVNSAMFRPYSVIPRNSDSLLGNTNFRWKGIYSQAAVNVSSDERLKKHIEQMNADDLAKFIGGLNVVSYQYKDDAPELDRIGLIAQEVIKADPALARYFVSVDGDGFYSLRPADLVFPLIAAVQQLQKDVEEAKRIATCG